MSRVAESTRSKQIIVESKSSEQKELEKHKHAIEVIADRLRTKFAHGKIPSDLQPISKYLIQSVSYSDRFTTNVYPVIHAFLEKKPKISEEVQECLANWDNEYVLANSAEMAKFVPAYMEYKGKCIDPEEFRFTELRPIYYWIQLEAFIENNVLDPYTTPDV